MKSIILFLHLFFTDAEEKSKVEVFIYNDRCISIEHVLNTESFYRSWYNSAKKMKLKGLPIFTNNDVENFDLENFEMVVSEQGWTHLEETEIPLKGIPVMLVVNDEIAYGAWLWRSDSPYDCDGVYLEYNKDEEGRKLFIKQDDLTEDLRLPESLKEPVSE